MALIASLAAADPAPAAAATSSNAAPSFAQTSILARGGPATIGPATIDPAAIDPVAPSPAPTPAAPQLDPLPSALVTSIPLTISGTAEPTETIDVSAGSSAGRDAQCVATVGSDGRFSCAVPRLPDGPRVPVRAVARTSGLADSGQVSVLSPPVITLSEGTHTGGGIRGTAYPGATVTVTAETGARCSFPADGSGTWGCVLAGLSDGPHTVQATQLAPFSSTHSMTSAAVAIVVDTVAPAAPTIASPRTGASIDDGGAFEFAGEGESGNTVTVYASTPEGATVVCTATVNGGSWSCSGTLAAGSYRVSALQRDRAGNVSAGSNTVAVTVATVSSAIPPGTRTPTRTPTTVPSPAPDGPTTAPSAPPSGPETAHPDTKGWIGSPFTSASAPTVTADSVPGWLRSLALALAALLLLVLPARLLIATLARTGAAFGPRSSAPRTTRAVLFGRNRSTAELSEADALLGRRSAEQTANAQPVWLAPVVTAIAAALVTLSTSVHDATDYLRLLLAVAVAVAAVNAVWVAAARGMARHLGEQVPPIVVRPVLLLAVGAAAVFSRLIGWEPALLFGLVLSVRLPDELDRVARGRIGAVQLSAVAALGVLAWLAVGLLPTASGTVSAFFVELANALAFLGIGSAALALLPFGGLVGRAILRWSRPIWLGLSVVVFTVLFALLLPVASLAETGAGALVGVLATVVFAALCVCVWLWERYIEPAR